jgi:hypothetical protein
MPPSFTTTGGARIGWTNATWPLAQLSATPDALTISVRLLGTYSFGPDQVAAVERYTLIPVLGWGIQIRHCRVDYPQCFIFWSLGSPDTVLRGIHAAGFVPTAPSSAVIQPRGFALRWSAIIIAVAVWNALFLLDFSRGSGTPPQLGLSALVALAFAFAFSIGTLRSPRLQHLVLKPGRSVNEIRPLLRLLAFVSGIVLVIFSIIFACGGFNQRA